MDNQLLRFWGYCHIDGSLKLKRYLDEDDIRSAIESEFVKRVFRPFFASGYSDALDRLRAMAWG